MSRIPSEIQVNGAVSVPGCEIEVATARAGGPGGQKVNKTESKVILRWNPAASRAFTPEVRALVLANLGSRLTNEGDLLLSCSEERSQHRNLEDGLRRFAQIVREALVAPKARIATTPSDGSRERRMSDKRFNSLRKQDRRFD